jgi:hypothetical protein
LRLNAGRIAHQKAFNIIYSLMFVLNTVVGGMWYHVATMLFACFYMTGELIDLKNN